MKTLFYASSLTTAQVAEMTIGLAEAVGHDLIQLPTAGGDADRELAVPNLDGMDEVVVDSARVQFRGVQVQRPAEGF
ncbi:MAG: hypothetical protein QOI99_86, partial [Actinomycetota bacterium]|nr:hypothetical protein [Actinomycetota bacterium]